MSNIQTDPIELANYVLIENGHPITTSRIIADRFHKEHRNVLDAVRALDCSDRFRALNFKLANYLDKQDKPRPMVKMTRDGFMFLIMGFIGKKAARIKEAYIDAFNQLEQRLKGQAALPVPDAVMLTDSEKTRIDDMERRVKTLWERVAYFENRVGNLCAAMHKDPVTITVPPGKRLVGCVYENIH